MEDVIVRRRRRTGLALAWAAVFAWASAIFWLSSYKYGKPYFIFSARAFILSSRSSGTVFTLMATSATLLSGPACFFANSLIRPS